MAELKLSTVNKAYGTVKVLHDVELDIKDGEFVVFVGPSGCGKSTLLRVIAGLEEVTEGKIAIGGRDVSALSPAERKIAMVFQSYALYPHMSVRKNLAFGLENLKFKRAEIEARIAEAARMLAIEPYLDRRPKQLSGGQRQRVAIGRAIVREPDIFLFDEPLSNLDAALRVQTRAEITKLHREIKTTMIYVTHDQVEAMTMADKIVVLRAGRVEQVGAPLELFDHPRNLFVAGFLGSPRMNIIKGKVAAITESGIAIDVASGGRIVSDADPAGIAVGQEVLAGIRPAHFSRSSGQGLPFVVQYHEGLGTETYVYGNLEGQDEQIIIHEAGHFAPHQGDRLVIDADPARIHLFDPKTELAFARRSGQGRR
ncbi:sn-glycerol-3-phosphate ABC transporter ATP-binding protein UgpC (plasmid) [Rhizobium sp. Pop5]|uniref:ABC transporter ATP-binding protein n=1 Tax=Rhizobium sp. Pop5 TaxID=1223565 RepID=UPI0021577D1B|nr:sn-glycerol-3-phosphate ABC transporter ATP-binding protein UgpC [Rhizobium sp. Pop5]UVD60683.1 sn-glycerol-3-phosphate ABC transporter ATP-binding protein UgpC [Rhizobium sp. Pop5]